MAWWLTLWLAFSAPNPVTPAVAAAPRIVSLAPCATEIIFALGAGATVVGVTRYDDFPVAVTALPKVGGLLDPDEEAVAALHPSLIIALPSGGSTGRIRRLERLGARVVLLPAASLSDLWHMIAALGTLLQRDAEATALTATLRRQLAGVRADAAAHHPVPLRALVLVGQRPWVAAGDGSFIADVLPMVGARNVLTRGGTYPVLDAEAVLAAHPDVVIDLVEGNPATRNDDWLHGAHIRVVHSYDTALMRPGPRLPAALERLAASLWPTPPEAP